MRKVLVCLTVLALLAFGGAAMAQPTPACGTLAAADCDVLTQSAAAQATLTSATFTFSLDINAGGQPLPLTGDGSYAIDPAVLASLNADALSNVSDPTAIVGLVGQALKGFNGELNVDLMGLPLNLKLVNGTGYFNFEMFAPMLQGGPITVPAGWAGLDLVGAIEMLSPMLSSMDLPSTDDAAVDPAQQQALMDAITQHVVVVRGPDENGQAVFVTSLDIAGLLQNDAFLGLIMEQSGQELTEAQLAEIAPMLQGFAGSVNFSATQKIDLSSYFITSVGFEFALDGDAISAMSGEAVEDIAVAGEFNFADFNAAPAISAPAGAPVATIMDLMGVLGAMGGGF